MSNYTTSQLSADELRARAAQREQDAADSFERCDTDGFLSQWASGLNAAADRMAAALIESGGMSTFAALYDVETNERIPAKLIDGRYGLCWALCDDSGKFSGTFVRAFPARESTMRRKGYREGVELAPARVQMRGTNACTVRPIVERIDDGIGTDPRVMHVAEDADDVIVPCGDFAAHAHFDCDCPDENESES